MQKHINPSVPTSLNLVNPRKYLKGQLPRYTLEEVLKVLEVNIETTLINVMKIGVTSIK